MEVERPLVPGLFNLKADAASRVNPLRVYAYALMSRNKLHGVDSTLGEACLRAKPARSPGTACANVLFAANTYVDRIVLQAAMSLRINPGSPKNLCFFGEEEQGKPEEQEEQEEPAGDAVPRFIDRSRRSNNQLRLYPGLITDTSGRLGKNLR